MNANYLKVYCSLFATIAWGGAVRTVIKTFQLSIPYTVVLLITGLVLGLGSRVDAHFCETWSMFTKFARTPPELILYIFLPLLVSNIIGFIVMVVVVVVIFTYAIFLLDL